jgi:hypothetical protein
MTSNIKDRRTDIYNYINSITLIESEELKNYFNINNFKNKFNSFQDTLYVNLDFWVDEIFVYYKKNPKNPSLSNTIFNLINSALVLSEDKFYNSYDATKKRTLFNSPHMTGIGLSQDKSTAKNQIKEFRSWFWTKFSNSPDLITRMSNSDAHNSRNIKIFNKLYDLGIFDFYNYIRKLEATNYDSIYDTRIKQLSLYINQYYFLSEILLKLLLDVESNNIIDSTSLKIFNNFEEYKDNDELGIHRPNNWTSKEQSSRYTKCVNGKNPSESDRLIKNKLIRDIYDIIVQINNDSQEIINQEKDINNIEQTISDSRNQINSLTLDNTTARRSVTTMTDKNTNIKAKRDTSQRTLLLMYILVPIILILTLWTVSKFETEI